MERLQKELKDNATVHKTTLDSLTAAQKALERERTELKSELNALKEAEAMRKDKEGNEQNKALEARLVEQTRKLMPQDESSRNRRNFVNSSKRDSLVSPSSKNKPWKPSLNVARCTTRFKSCWRQCASFLRVRPTDNEPAVKCAPDGSSLNLQRIDGKDDAAFEFDRVFDPTSSKRKSSKRSRSSCNPALDGYKVCLFSYGQTGSGKTHTMLGDGNGDMRGIIPRSVAKIVEASEKNAHKGWSYTMHACVRRNLQRTSSGLAQAWKFSQR